MTPNSSSHTLIVDIDEKSLKELGQWPWSRLLLSKLLENIYNSFPSAIGVDIIFPEKDRLSPIAIEHFYKEHFHIPKSTINIPSYLQDNDLIFAHTLKNTSSILALYLSHTPLNSMHCNNINGLNLKMDSLQLRDYNYILCNTSTIQDNNSYYGFINISSDEDGILRRTSLLKEYKNRIIPSLALATLQSIDSNITTKDNRLSILNHTIATNKHTDLLLHFYPQGWFQKVSAVDIIKNRVDPKNFNGKIILIGSSAISLHDTHTIINAQRVPGVIIHATTIENILQDKLIVQPTYYPLLNTILSLIFSFLLFYLLIRKKNIAIVIFSTLLLSSAFITALLLYTNGIYISLGYFTTPFVFHIFLISFIFIFIDSYERRIFSEELNRSHTALLDSMVYVAEVHDIETGAHIIRTKKYIKLLATHILNKGLYSSELSEEKIEMMYLTAPLHDVGKVGIADAILKKPGKLTAEEFEIMKTHASIGKEIIKNAISSYKKNAFLLMAKNIAHYHHEKWDGSGYPQGLKEHQIPLEARFMAIADVYDALVSRRVYKDSFSYEQTVQTIVEGRAKHFDPTLVDAFLEIKEEFQKIAETYKDQDHS